MHTSETYLTCIWLLNWLQAGRQKDIAGMMPRRVSLHAHRKCNFANRLKGLSDSPGQGCILL